MKGFIKTLGALLGCAALAAGGAGAVRAQCPAPGCVCPGCFCPGVNGAPVGSPVGPSQPGCVGSCKGCPEGCCAYRSLVDPCYPERYNYMARAEVNAAMAPQVHNGHVLDQTLWNYFFEPGSDRLTSAGLSHLAYIARRRPHADPVVYLQTAQDVIYDPAHPELLVASRGELNQKRAQAVYAFLAAQTGCHDFQVALHDPAEVGLASIPVGFTIQQMYFTRFRGGLVTGAGGSTSGGGGIGGGGVGAGGGGGGAGGVAGGASNLGR